MIRLCACTVLLVLGCLPPLGAQTAAPTGNFVRRFFKAYADDWKGAAPSGDVPKFRGYPAPVAGPPFPFTVWPYGGSPVIGQPWTQAGPFMTAIWGGSTGDGWKKSGVQIYGWLNSGVNASTSTGGGYSNYPEAYVARGNNILLDQAMLFIERQPDTVQTDHVDWGFRVAGLYGLDYRFTTAKGIFNHQLLGKNQENGFDPLMMYFDLYLPKVAQGLNIRAGRYLSVPDIEGQPAAYNYVYSHSLAFTFDCVTQTGVLATTKLSNHWMVQAGLSAGCDVAPWVKPDARPTVNGCVGYTWRDGLDNTYVCANSNNNGHYAYNNVQAYYTTWYHKFSKNSRWHIATENWYQWQRQVPNVNNAVGRTLLETNANGAVCDRASEITCFAPSYAIVNYLENQLSAHDYLSIRNEFLDDFKGQRTSYRSRYTAHTLGWGHWTGTTMLVRPELRYERSYDVAAYNNGTKKGQLTLSCDLTWFF
jgi:hypothetical protein